MFLLRYFLQVSSSRYCSILIIFLLIFHLQRIVYVRAFGLRFLGSFLHHHLSTKCYATSPALALTWAAVFHALKKIKLRNDECTPKIHQLHRNFHIVNDSLFQSKDSLLASIARPLPLPFSFSTALFPTNFSLPQ